MRSKFDEQLAELNHETTIMGTMCEDAIGETTDALIKGNVEEAKELESLLDQIKQKEREIESICLRLLLQQQPVARDLRTISSALKMITDMERIGTQSADIAEIIVTSNMTRLGDRFGIQKMSSAVIEMVNGCVDAFVEKDMEKAESVIDYDDVVDHQFDVIKERLIDECRKESADSAYILDLLMIIKYFERIGDHAVNIAEWVIFSITGHHPRITQKTHDGRVDPV